MPRPNINLAFAGSVTFKSYTNGTNSTSLRTRGRSSETTSGVARRKPSGGWIPPTNYTVSADYYQGGEGTHEVKLVTPTATVGQIYTGTVLSVDNLGPYDLRVLCDASMTSAYAFTDSSDLQARAMIQALSRLKDMDVDLGTAFGERNSTARQLGDAARSLANAYRNVRKGRVRQAMRDLGLSAQHGVPRGSSYTSKWLGLQYGWKPMLSDIYGAVESLRKKPPETWKVTAKGRASESENKSVVLYPTGSTATGYNSYAYVKRGAFVRLDAIPTSPLLGTLASVGVLNPINIAWELVPLSFVVDWAFGIGDYLSVIDAQLGYSNVEFSSSWMREATWRISGNSGKLASGARVTNDFSGSKRAFRLTRSTGVNPSPPFPRLKDPRSFGHMANGLALLSQAFTGSPNYHHYR